MLEYNLYLYFGNDSYQFLVVNSNLKEHANRF